MYSLQRNFQIRCIATKVARYYSGSVDGKEISHYNNLAKNWLDTMHGPAKALYAMNDIRIPFIRSGLINMGKLKEDACNDCKYLTGLKLLDVGCGGGILSVPLARLGGDVTGLDASIALIEVAKNYAKDKLNPNSTMKFISTTIEEHSISNKNSYDVVILSEVLEHVLEKQAFIQACIDALKPGGSFFITTINKTYSAWIVAILMAEYVLNVVPRGNHEWSKLVPVADLKDYLANAGCKIFQMNGLMYNPYQNEWRWISNQSIFYAVHAIKQK